MNLFVVNLLMALLWTLLQGRLGVDTLLIGFLIGYVTLSVLYRSSDKRKKSYLSKTLQLIGFMLYYMKELVVSSVQVAVDVLKPLPHIRPGVVGIPLTAKTDLEITLLANLISLTPGTLSLDVSQDHKILYIHAMYVIDPDELRAEIKSGIERRLLEVLR